MSSSSSSEALASSTCVNKDYFLQSNCAITIKMILSSTANFCFTFFGFAVIGVFFVGSNFSFKVISNVSSNSLSQRRQSFSVIFAHSLSGLSILPTLQSTVLNYFTVRIAFLVQHSYNNGKNTAIYQ